MPHEIPSTGIISVGTASFIKMLSSINLYVSYVGHIRYSKYKKVGIARVGGADCISLGVERCLSIERWDQVPSMGQASREGTGCRLSGALD